MQRLRGHHGQLPPVLSQLRIQALKLIGPWLLAVLITAAFLLPLPPAAVAAEVLQVSGANLLQVGDRNRSLTVELACLAVDPAGEAQAVAWLRHRLPRGTRVNLRPMGMHAGTFTAQVRRLDTGEDLSEGLIGAGLAAAVPCPDEENG